MPKRDWMVEFRDNLLHGILQFWIDHGIDREYGGAMGWLDRQGNPILPGTKSVAQQARLLWAFSEVYRRYPEPVYAEAAAHLLKFLRTSFWEANRGGYDMTAYWCRAGSAASCTPPGFPAIIPQPGPAYGDSLGGMTIAGGIAAGHDHVLDGGRDHHPLMFF